MRIARGFEMQRRTIARASAILSIAMLLGCTAPPAPANEVGKVVGVSEFGGFFHVAKTGPNGAIIVCTYYTAYQPGEHFQPRGCEELPAQ